MRYYSDVTNEMYNTEKELRRAEDEYQKKQQEKIRQEEAKRLLEEKAREERAMAAKVVESKRSDMVKAQKAYREALESFCKKYGSYHFTTNSFDNIPHLFDFFTL